MQVLVGLLEGLTESGKALAEVELIRNSLLYTRCNSTNSVHCNHEKQMNYVVRLPWQEDVEKAKSGVLKILAGAVAWRLADDVDKAIAQAIGAAVLPRHGGLPRGRVLAKKLAAYRGLIAAGLEEDEAYGFSDLKEFEGLAILASPKFVGKTDGLRERLDVVPLPEGYFPNKMGYVVADLNAVDVAVRLNVFEVVPGEETKISILFTYGIDVVADALGFTDFG